MPPPARFKHLHAWAVGRPIVIAMMAQRAALQGRYIRDIAGFWGSGEIRLKAAALAPNDDRWLAMYRDPARVKERLAELVASPEHDELPLFFARRAIRAERDPVELELARARLASAPHRVKAMLRATMEAVFRHMYQQHLAGLAEDMAAENHPPPPPPDEPRDVPPEFRRELSGALPPQQSSLPDRHPRTGVIAGPTPGPGVGANPVARPGVDEERLFQQPEMLFFVLSLLPCALVHGESAWELYGRARNGDRVATQNLIRIDPRALLDQDIAREAMGLGSQDDQAVRHLTAESLEKEVALPSDAKQVNYLVAGLIGRTAEIYSHKLGTKDMCDLLDAAEKDWTGDPLAVATDFVDTPEGQRQAIYRYKLFWDKILPRDTVFDPACHEELGLMAVVSDDHASEARPTWLDQLERPEQPDPRIWELCRRLAEQVWAGIRRM